MRTGIILNEQEAIDRLFAASEDGELSPAAKHALTGVSAGTSYITDDDVVLEFDAGDGELKDRIEFMVPDMQRIPGVCDFSDNYELEAAIAQVVNRLFVGTAVAAADQLGKLQYSNLDKDLGTLMSARIEIRQNNQIKNRIPFESIAAKISDNVLKAGSDATVGYGNSLQLDERTRYYWPTDLGVLSGGIPTTVVIYLPKGVTVAAPGGDDHRYFQVRWMGKKLSK